MGHFRVEVGDLVWSIVVWESGQCKVLDEKRTHEMKPKIKTPFGRHALLTNLPSSPATRAVVDERSQRTGVRTM